MFIYNEKSIKIIDLQCRKDCEVYLILKKNFKKGCAIKWKRSKSSIYKLRKKNLKFQNTFSHILNYFRPHIVLGQKFQKQKKTLQNPE